jgi:hypothetical protein
VCAKGEVLKSTERQILIEKTNKAVYVSFRSACG